jgi:hypothetical protein
MRSRSFRAALLMIFVLPVLASAEPSDQPDHFGIDVKILLEKRLAEKQLDDAERIVVFAKAFER